MPRIQMTKTVRITLILLMIYVIGSLALILIKFLRVM